MPQTYLDFEQSVAEIDKQIDVLQAEEPQDAAALKALKEKSRKELKAVYSKIGAWEKTRVARHGNRPHFSDYIEGLINDFTPLAGDRKFGDDPALMGGLGKIRGHSVVIIGHEKGKDTESRVQHNFGMAQPEGYRKAVRLMDMAERFSLPLISFVDTAGAYPGRGACWSTPFIPLFHRKAVLRFYGATAPGRNRPPRL